MNLIRKTIFLWLVLALAAAYDNSAYALRGGFHYADFTLIACVALLIADRIYTAYIFGICAALIHDAFLMPSQGFSAISLFGALLTASALCMSLYRGNYSSRVIILASAEVVKEITRGILVFVYYNSMKKFEFPPAVLLKAALTIAAGAVIYKIMEIDYGRLAPWLKPGMIFRKK